VRDLGLALESESLLDSVAFNVRSKNSTWAQFRPAHRRRRSQGSVPAKRGTSARFPISGVVLICPDSAPRLRFTAALLVQGSNRTVRPTIRRRLISQPISQPRDMTTYFHSSGNTSLTWIGGFQEGNPLDEQLEDKPTLSSIATTFRHSPPPILNRASAVNGRLRRGL
jgi:hypothetical protein